MNAPLRSLSKIVFDRLSEVNRAAKTSKSTPKCIEILERGSEESAASGG